jgi:hypothetical protein
MAAGGMQAPTLQEHNQQVVQQQQQQQRGMVAASQTQGCNIRHSNSHAAGCMLN